MPPPALKRSFRDLSDAEVGDIEKASMLARAGLYGNVGWEELLQSRRVLIVSEAGAGKTYECQAQQVTLWNAGEAAFYLDLATLSGSSVREMLIQDEENRFDAWLRSQSEVATFFLDSIDELKLTLGKFEQALKRFNKALAGQLGRARVITTTRPVPIDRDLIAKYLPVPPSAETAPTAEAFADIVMDRSPKAPGGEGKAKTWRNVGLMPLSPDEMREFVILQGVSDPDVLLTDIQERDAEEFAKRPQDLIELCSDWREHHRVRTHRDQVETNVATKLKPSTKRKERAELSSEKAFEGASRLALAAILTRKLTLRHSAGTDSVDASEVALDGSKILLDWTDAERATLLERPLFGFASYGRVRFHHRSVMEFLSAKRLDSLLAGGASIKSIKRLLFTETVQGARTIRPSMRAVAAWLALSRETIFEDVISLDPAIVLDHGDPQSLRPAQRTAALEAYVSRFGDGGWRGLSPPRIQVHRFASPELDQTVKRLWDAGIENEEVRGLLLKIIGAGKLVGCADIAFAVATDNAQKVHERGLAIDALLQLRDRRLESMASSLENDAARWPDAIARQAAIDLFPAHLPVSRLSRILGRLRQVRGYVGDLDYRLPHEIETASLTPKYLDELRQALTGLMLDGITWERDKFPHLRTKRPDLKTTLAAVCRRQAVEGVRTEAWVSSCLLAIRLSKEDTDKESIVALRQALASLSPNLREAAFFTEDAFLAQLHRPKDIWGRIFDLSQNGGIQLNDEKDAQWVRKRLSDPHEPLDRREMMLWAEMTLLNRSAPDHRALLEALKEVVSDAPTLLALIDERLEPQPGSAQLRRMQALNAKRARHSKRRKAKDHASWVTFWREIAQYPDKVFAPDRAENTVWNLWRAIERSGEKSRASGWSRRFIEAQFGKDVADRLREAMMAYWRKDKPTLRSERPEGEKDRFLIRWQLGLAAIGAEAEDPSWAKRLDESEAELACRYAPIEFNGFPFWLESLAIEHPAAVDRILGEELSHSLREAIDTDAYSMFLQNISHASAIIAALFIPRVRSWVTEIAKAQTEPNHSHSGQNLRQATRILLESGNDEDRRFLESIAKQRLESGLSVPFARVWLPVLLHLNPTAGVEAIERGLKDTAISKTGAGVQLFAQAFHRDRGNAVDLGATGFTPSLLLRLVRQAYRHVQIEDDAQHEGSYSPDTRDDAERGRSAVLSALLSTTGVEGWTAKLEMANDPLFAHFRDRAIALAQEKAAEEADRATLTDADFVRLDRTGEAPPATTGDMFALMRDRLDDIDDLLLQDISPRELWSSIADEHIMRREIARVLRDAGKQSYTVDQEAVTADEKETDIRLRSKSGQQGTIELKLGDRRAGKDLFDTIKDQLLTKYMAAEDCRAGCLLVTIAKERQWEHPKTHESLNFEGLMAVLQEEAERLSRDLAGSAKIMVKGLDLRPRLRRGRSMATR
jgi:hypothetical protein